MTKKIVTPFLLHYLIVTTFAIALFSCKKNTNTAQKSNDGNSVYEYIKKLGFSENSIQDAGDKYIVEGDILFDKNSKPDFSIFSGTKTEQYGTANYVGLDYQTNITVFPFVVPSQYIPDIQNAINLWNSVPNCRIKFQYGTSRTSNSIEVVNVALPSCGQAWFPMDGKPGFIVGIDFADIANYSAEQRVRTIAHELGHAIGLMHTNWQGLESQSGTTNNGAYYNAMHILGTPTGTDANSLMNDGECGVGATTFSSYDIVAIQFLYPASPTVPGSIPLFRYFGRTTNGDHYYTTDINTLRNGTNNGWIFEGIGMFVFSNQIDNTIPVYRWYSASAVDHYYTTNPLDKPAGYSLESSTAFYVYPSAINGALPVYRYYNATTGDHFYTKDPDEVTFMPGYAAEGIAWYAH
jgi:hypothetical protein